MKKENHIDIPKRVRDFLILRDQPVCANFSPGVIAEIAKQIVAANTAESEGRAYSPALRREAKALLVDLVENAATTDEMEKFSALLSQFDIVANSANRRSRRLVGEAALAAANALRPELLSEVQRLGARRAELAAVIADLEDLDLDGSAALVRYDVLISQLRHLLDLCDFAKLGDVEPADLVPIPDFNLEAICAENGIKPAEKISWQNRVRGFVEQVTAHQDRLGLEAFYSGETLRAKRLEAAAAARPAPAEKSAQQATGPLIEEPLSALDA